jgi:methionyl-tRNA formyltransferase
MSNKILFFGNERLATGVGTTAPALQALIGAGYEVAALIVAQNDSGRSRRPRPLEVAEVAAAHGIPLLAPDNLAGARDELAAYGAEAAVLIAYGKIVPPEVLSLFPRGIVNVHPSLLPLHRGSTPIETVILEGAAETGVSLMKLIEKMDAGPVYEQVRLPLAGNETKQALAGRLSVMGAELLMKHLPGVLDGSAADPAPQDDSAATFDPHIVKADGTIDWSKPAAQLEREIRAYAGWPRSRTSLGLTGVIITAARAAAVPAESAQNAVPQETDPGTLRIDGKQLAVHCGQGELLIIDSLIPDGKREMPAEAFLAGYR